MRKVLSYITLLGLAFFLAFSPQTAAAGKKNAPKMSAFDKARADSLESDRKEKARLDAISLREDKRTERRLAVEDIKRTTKHPDASTILSKQWFNEKILGRYGILYSRPVLLTPISGRIENVIDSKTVAVRIPDESLPSGVTLPPVIVELATAGEFSAGAPFTLPNAAKSGTREYFWIDRTVDVQAYKEVPGLSYGAYTNLVHNGYTFQPSSNSQ